MFALLFILIGYISISYKWISSSPVAISLECSNIANPLTFKMMIIFGIYLVLVYVAVGIFIKRITIKTITSIYKHFIIFRKIEAITFRWKAFGLVLSALSGATLIWSNNFYVSYLFLCILLSCGNFATLLGGLCQDLFPTNLKYVQIYVYIHNNANTTLHDFITEPWLFALFLCLVELVVWLAVT